ncbi:MAG: DUF2508 family protein [Bacillota bacterium]|nr:DUF2508 family protein [Bacillota bacterium]
MSLDWQKLYETALHVGRQAVERLTGHKEEDPSLAEWDAVEKARREWHLAQAYFDAVDHPDLVEQAVHRILAAERHYIYLLRQAREKGLQYPFIPH